PIELQIAALIKNGLASKEITGEMNISIETVKTHRRNIRKKLHLHNADINLSSFLKSKAF
ncbi:MAG: helix-turn-helix transcriptional regulator, partial [Thermodesulfobacteriota bacterium]